MERMILVILVSFVFLSGCGSEEEEERPVPVVDGSQTPEVTSPAYTPGVLNEDLYVSFQVELEWARETNPGETVDTAVYHERFGVTADEMEAFEEELQQRDRLRAVEVQIFLRLDELRGAEGVELVPPEMDQTADTFDIDTADGGIEINPSGE